jgi:hypothetical protein
VVLSSLPMTVADAIMMTTMTTGAHATPAVDEMMITYTMIPDTAAVEAVKSPVTETVLDLGTSRAGEVVMDPSPIWETPPRMREGPRK